MIIEEGGMVRDPKFEKVCTRRKNRVNGLTLSPLVR